MRRTKLSVKQERILDEMRDYGAVIYSHHAKGSFTHKTMVGTCERTGVSQVTLEALISKGMIEPQGDGLFDGFAQTYKISQRGIEYGG